MGTVVTVQVLPLETPAAGLLEPQFTALEFFLEIELFHLATTLVLFQVTYALTWLEPFTWPNKPRATCVLQFAPTVGVIDQHTVE
jgi:hypothetical protein